MKSTCDGMLGTIILLSYMEIESMLWCSGSLNSNSSLHGHLYYNLIYSGLKSMEIILNNSGKSNK